MELKLLSSLVKVFSDEAPSAEPLEKLSVFKNEKFGFQMTVKPEKDVKVKPSADISTNIFIVEEIPSQLACPGNADDYFLRRTAGRYPDLLRPVKGEVAIKAGEWVSFWFEAQNLPAGTKKVTVRLSGDAEAEAAFTLEVIDADLPAQSLICTNWFHTDSLMLWYGAEAFSDEYWRITENYIRTAVEHGINLILTPLFTPPLDTYPGKERPTVQLVDIKKEGNNYSFGFSKLKRWIEMCDRCGVKYFEMSHLFTQWGAKHAPKIMAEEDGKYKLIFGWKTKAGGKKYVSFLTQLAKVLTEFIDNEGIRERCYFHVSDEPNKAQLRSYGKAAALMKSLFPGFKIFDALSDFDFYKKGLTEIPVPANDRAEPFIGKVPEFWTYYCGGQHTKYVSNRYFAMPSARTRIIGYQLYKTGAAGFLHWGFNYWFTQFSKKFINPFEVSDAGGKFSSGDSYVVYPGEGGSTMCSLRLKMMNEAFQDMRALQLLESIAGRQEALAVLEEGLEKEITFKEYPHSEDWMLATRERINSRIKTLLEK